jgi:hypothetical protein
MSEPVWLGCPEVRRGGATRFFANSAAFSPAESDEPLACAAWPCSSPDAETLRQKEKTGGLALGASAKSVERARRKAALGEPRSSSTDLFARTGAIGAPLGGCVADALLVWADMFAGSDLAALPRSKNYPLTVTGRH